MGVVMIQYGHNSPVYTAHRRVGAHYTRRNFTLAVGQTPFTFREATAQTKSNKITSGRESSFF